MSTHTKMAQIKNIDPTKCKKCCGVTRTLTHCWWEYKIPLWETAWKLLKCWTYNPVIPLYNLPKRNTNVFPQRLNHEYL